MTSENKLQGKGSANKGQIGANAYVLWVPRLITATAILHVAVGFVFWTPFGEIVAAGIVDSILGDPERESAFWYMFTGLAWLALGGLARWTARETGRIPARLGGWLIGIGATLVVFVPASGGWLVAAVGVIALLAATGGGPRNGAQDAPELSNTDLNVGCPSTAERLTGGRISGHVR